MSDLHDELLSETPKEKNEYEGFTGDQLLKVLGDALDQKEKAEGIIKKVGDQLYYHHEMSAVCLGTHNLIHLGPKKPVKKEVLTDSRK